MSVNDKEPNPIPNDTIPIWNLVIQDMSNYKLTPLRKTIIKDMIERDANGVKNYGVHLQKYNGRNALIDGIQEIYDYVVYTRQAIAEHWDTLLEIEDGYISEYYPIPKCNCIKCVSDFIDYSLNLNLDENLGMVRNDLLALIYCYGLAFEIMENMKRLLIEDAE